MNIAVVLKSEISRLARKELKAETEALKKAAAKHRSEIAALKREMAALQRQVQALSKRDARQRQPKVEEEGGQPIRIRYSAKGLAAQRKRLGLSAEKFGKLVGVSGQTIYLWESEKTKPRNGQLQSIAAVRKMGRREAIAALEQQG
jgi:DNA-binding transcriptional regulator YiaG